MTRLLIVGGCGYFNIAILDNLSLGRKRLPGAISREVYRGQYLQFRCRQRGGRKGVGDRPSCGRHMVVDSINNQRLNFDVAGVEPFASYRPRLRAY